MNPTTAPDRIPARRRGLLALVATAALLAVAGPTAAWADTRLVQVDVLDRDNGEALHVWRDHGRPVVAGRPGARYAVRLSNNTGARVLVVVAIDGVNVLSGETASVGQRGYVLEPWQHADITGWRKSDDEVAAFEFTSLASSYAARTGRPQDVGVIGVAAFREAPAAFETNDAQPAPVAAAGSKAAPPAAESRRAKAAESGLDMADAGPLRKPVERLGTGHGARENSPVRITTFERASAQPDQRVEIRYDSLENLVAAGIAPPPRLATTSPHPFPADPPRGYVPDPPLR